MTSTPTHHYDLNQSNYIELKNDTLSLSEDNSDSKDKKNKRERRSKDEHHERNYICGCGKSYLSYAALYTHAKTKHDGVFPEGTTTLHKKKQGRPKKDDQGQNIQNPFISQSYDFSKDFINFLCLIPGNTTPTVSSGDSIIGSFP